MTSSKTGKKDQKIGSKAGANSTTTFWKWCDETVTEKQYHRFRLRQYTLKKKKPRGGDGEWTVTSLMNLNYYFSKFLSLFYFFAKYGASGGVFNSTKKQLPETETDFIPWIPAIKPRYQCDKWDVGTLTKKLYHNNKRDDDTVLSIKMSSHFCSANEDIGKFLIQSKGMIYFCVRHVCHFWCEVGYPFFVLFFVFGVFHNIILGFIIIWLKQQQEQQHGWGCSCKRLSSWRK